MTLPPSSQQRPVALISYPRLDGEDYAWYVRNRLRDEHGLALWQDREQMIGGVD
jgi:hypothetical protein